MKQDSIGRFIQVKEAFIKHLFRGVDGLVLTTPALEVFAKRERETRIALCPDRMVDKAEELLDQYQRAPNTNKPKEQRKGLNAPLPVLLVAFAKDMNPIAPDRGMSIPDERWVRLEDNPEAELYRMRLDHVENRVQIAFCAHEDETIKSMTSQLRLYFQAYKNKRWQIPWHFGGYDFTTTCSLENYEPMDELIEIPERSNISIVAWNLSLNFQMPYLNAPVPERTTSKNKRKGYIPVSHVDVNVTTRIKR